MDLIIIKFTFKISKLIWKQMGTNRKKIARQVHIFIVRTDNFVKNKFYSKIRRSIRNINQLSRENKE